MKPTLPTTQSDVKALLGGTAESAAEALGYNHATAFYKLREPLRHRVALAVIGAWYMQQSLDTAPAEQQQRRQAAQQRLTVSVGPGLARIMRGGQVA